jgi:hypothetical protein
MGEVYRATDPHEMPFRLEHRQPKFPGGLRLRGIHGDEAVDPLGAMKPAGRSQVGLTYSGLISGQARRGPAARGG